MTTNTINQTELTTLIASRVRRPLPKAGYVVLATKGDEKTVAGSPSGFVHSRLDHAQTWAAWNQSGNYAGYTCEVVRWEGDNE